MAYLTVPNFSQMSLQTLFDRAVNHIGSTGKKSFKGTRCCYGGSGCNAAPFLREDARKLADTADMGYSAGWDHLAADGLVPSTNSDFMSRLQSAHDNSTQGKEFRKTYDAGMRALAKKYLLNTKALDKLGWAK